MKIMPSISSLVGMEGSIIHLPDLEVSGTKLRTLKMLQLHQYIEESGRKHKNVSSHTTLTHIGVSNFLWVHT